MLRNSKHTRRNQFYSQHLEYRKKFSIYLFSKRRNKKKSACLTKKKRKEKEILPKVHNLAKDTIFSKKKVQQNIKRLLNSLKEIPFHYRH